MSKISFKNIETNHSGRIDFEVVENGSPARHYYFEFNDQVDPSNDAIAIAFCTLCGQKYESITMNLPVSDRVQKAAREFTRAELICQDGVVDERARGNKIVLNFSGGFDSLACLEVMPESTSLVTTDFGGWFSREVEFAKQFDPLILSTNVRKNSSDTPADQNLCSNSWTFMALGSILAAETVGAGAVSFGSIIGASNHPPRGDVAFPLWRALDLDTRNFVRGLTEIQTARIALRANPEKIVSALHSLAGANDPKRFRKAWQLKYLSDSEGLGILVDDKDLYPREPIKFGHAIAEDLTTLFMYSKLGSDFPSDVFEGIDSDSNKEFYNLDLSFMERYDPRAYEHFRGRDLKAVYEGFARHEVLPYLEEDWVSLRRVNEAFSGVY